MVLAWVLFLIYMIGTACLGWMGHRQTKDFGSFAIGKGDMAPWMVGITLAASTASAATFIINPGFVYVDGLAAFMHLGVSVFLGFLLMLWILSFRFRQIGSQAGALTIPDWIGKRYRSTSFSLYFAFLNLLSFAFIVLLVGGISIVMQKLLGIGNLAALLVTLIFVTSYVMFGGTYAHVFTNLFQGGLMIAVTLIVLYSGIRNFGFSGAFWSELSISKPQLLSWVNESSVFYKDIFSVYISGFLIGAALVCQPHILTKALYVKSDKAVRSYIGIFAIVFFLFTMLLLVGFWAHGALTAEQLTDPATGQFRQDLVMTVFLQQTFPDWVFTIISVVLLAAAMSTLDGLLVGVSTITANDLITNLMERWGIQFPDEGSRLSFAMKASHVVLVIMAIAVFAVTLNPPKLLGIFGQVGVYGLVLAAVPPLLAGVLFKNPSLKVAWFFSVFGILIHFILYFFGKRIFPEAAFAFSNPGATASVGLIGSVLPALIFCWAGQNQKGDF